MTDLNIHQLEKFAKEGGENEATAEMLKEVENSVTQLEIVETYETIFGEAELNERFAKIKETYDNIVNTMISNGVKIVDNIIDIEFNEEKRTITQGLIIKKALGTIKTVEFFENAMQNMIPEQNMELLTKIANKKAKVNDKRWRKVKNKVNKEKVAKRPVTKLKPL